jgi:hypothetical protein
MVLLLSIIEWMEDVTDNDLDNFDAIHHCCVNILWSNNPYQVMAEVVGFSLEKNQVVADVYYHLE